MAGLVLLTFDILFCYRLLTSVSLCRRFHLAFVDVFFLLLLYETSSLLLCPIFVMDCRPI